MVGKQAKLLSGKTKIPRIGILSCQVGRDIQTGAETNLPSVNSFTATRGE